MSNRREGPRFAPRSTAGAILCGLLAVVAVAVFWAGESAWRPLDQFSAEFGFEQRWPDHLRIARLEPSADLGALVLADAVVMGEVGKVRWSDLDEEARVAWMKSLDSREDELRTALGLVLRGAAVRPGWHLSYHFAGKLSYLLERRGGAQSPIESEPPWGVALGLAGREAPGYVATPVFLGAAFLESWGRLSDSIRQEAEPVFRSALMEAGFVREALPVLAVVTSPGTAVALVPNSPEPLRAAREVMSASGATPEVKSLHERWLRAEKGSRRVDLAVLERKAALGDTDSLRGLCVRFASRHPVHEMDDAEGRSQAARLLGLWPPEGAKRWANDPRAAIVRFFLEGREESAPGSALSRAVESMPGVPEYVRARAYLLGGDPAKADELASASLTAGSLEWTPYHVARVWNLLGKGQAEEAGASLRRIARAARNECDVLLARRAVARASAGTAAGTGEEGDVDAVLESVRAFPLAMSDSGGVFPCLDPEEDAGRYLMVDLEGGEPAVVRWGWNGGTSGVVEVSGQQTLRVPLSGWRGRTLLSLRPLSGRLPAAVRVSFDPPLAKQVPQ